MNSVEFLNRADVEELTDDCVVCQAIKLAQASGREPTLAELREAFKEAEQTNPWAGTMNTTRKFG